VAGFGLDLRRRLGGGFETPLALIFLEGHISIVTRAAGRRLCRTAKSALWSKIFTTEAQRHREVPLALDVLCASVSLW
jgi:hypothetical protein